MTHLFIFALGLLVILKTLVMPTLHYFGKNTRMIDFWYVSSPSLSARRPRVNRAFPRRRETTILEVAVSPRQRFAALVNNIGIRIMFCIAAAWDFCVISDADSMREPRRGHDA